MKISSVECFPVQDGRNSVFVVIDTDEGIHGVGEAGMPHHAEAIAGVVWDYSTYLATSNVGVMEQPQRPGRAMTNVVPVQMTWEDGYTLAPTKPGLGVEFDRDAARRMPHQPAGPMRPLLHRDDGSFTNW